MVEAIVFVGGCIAALLATRARGYCCVVEWLPTLRIIKVWTTGQSGMLCHVLS